MTKLLLTLSLLCLLTLPSFPQAKVATSDTLPKPIALTNEEIAQIREIERQFNELTAQLSLARQQYQTLQLKFFIDHKLSADKYVPALVPTETGLVYMPVMEEKKEEKTKK